MFSTKKSLKEETPTKEFELEDREIEPQKLQIQEEESLDEQEDALETSEEEDDEEEGELAVDVYQTDKELVIQSAIAGIRPDALDVSIEDDLVVISGERRHPAKKEIKKYYHQECFWGPFSREIILPEDVDVNGAEATMKDGVFTLRIPRVFREKIKKVEIKKAQN